MKQIPCITKKCILYPACKHKSEIDCSMLHDWFESEVNTVKEEDDKLDPSYDIWITRTVWLHLNLTLSTLCKLYSNQKRKDCNVAKHLLNITVKTYKAPYDTEVMTFLNQLEKKSK